MKYRRLGNSGLKVSEIAYGSWLTFANQVELDNAKQIINRAIELGINYFDSAATDTIKKLPWWKLWRQ